MSDPKVIEWAFLCAFAELDDYGGVNAAHIHDMFELSDLPIFVVSRLTVPQHFSGAQTYRRGVVFRWSIFIKTDAQEDIEISSEDMLIDEKVLIRPIGHSLVQPGHYTVELRADGALQQRLDLFLE